MDSEHPAEPASLTDARGGGFARCEFVRDAAGSIADFRFLEMNDAFETYLGVSRDRAVGHLRNEVLPSDDAWWIEAWAPALAANEAVRIERFSASLRRWFDIRFFPRKGDRFVLVVEDVTLAKQAEESLRFRLLVTESSQVMWSTDARGMVIEESPSWCAFTGQTMARCMGMGWADAIHADDRVAAMQNWFRCVEMQSPFGAEIRLWSHAANAWQWMALLGVPLKDSGGAVVSWFGTGRDVHERKCAEAERDALRRQLAALEEEERRRVARELHDQLGQQLTALELGVDDVSRIVASFSPHAYDTALRARLEKLKALAREMTLSVRTISLQLRPPEIDDIGLESALENYMREWTSRCGIRADLAVRGTREHGVPPEAGAALYRIAQEALNNVAKHAHAQRAGVVVLKSPSEIELIVEDDGRGFHADDMRENGVSGRRFGLAGMRERAALIGGTLTVESEPGRGTTLYVRVPA
jgi:PAS domain S-box-containing protein